MRTPEVDRWVAMVKSKSEGRTRWKGQEPFEDESVVAHIELLERKNKELKGLLNKCVPIVGYAADCKRQIGLMEHHFQWEQLREEIEQAVE